MLPLVCLAVWLFYPRYDLDVALKPGPSNYVVVEQGFYSLKACQKAASGYRHYDWVALEWTQWGKMFNKYSPYNQKVRP